MATWTPTEDKVEALGKAVMMGRWRSNTPEWHEARKGIGGSDIGAICGVNRWKSAEDLLAEKLDPDHKGITANLAMRMGTVFENPIRQLWKEDNADFLDVHGTGTWQSLVNPIWKANPDGLIQYHNGDLGILEIKYTARKWTEVPEYYRLQVLWYMHVLGVEDAILVQATGHTLTEWRIDYDEETIANVLRHVEAFENRMKGIN
jgi:putative phage-type endonuclease